ncbi:MAG: cupredoxin family copper-binding protein [bacterium]
MNLRKPYLLVGLFLVLLSAVALTSCSSDKSNDPGDTGNNSTATTISIADFAFSPASRTVKVGTTVKWTNNDAAAHTVTSDNGAFTSSGNLAQNQSYEVTFSTAGSFPYHCALHPSMTGSVTVTE